MALIVKGDMPTFCERLTEDGNNMEYCRFACVCESHNISTMAIPSDCPILGEIPNERLGKLKDIDVIAEMILKNGSFDAKQINVITRILIDAPVVVEASNC